MNRNFRIYLVLKLLVGLQIEMFLWIIVDNYAELLTKQDEYEIIFPCENHRLVI